MTSSHLGESTFAPLGMELPRLEGVAKGCAMHSHFRVCIEAQCILQWTRYSRNTRYYLARHLLLMGSASLYSFLCKCAAFVACGSVVLVFR